MNAFKPLNNIAGWLMFAVAAVVYILTAEPTGSLWDCGEFISAAYKLEVVHPPGAPLFLMIGRMFAWVADVFSADKANIAYAMNVMSGLCTAALVMFVFWSTTILARLSLLGYGKPVKETGDKLAILGAGVVAALATTFTTSVWFSAVEGEVYAMSSGFTGLVIWSALRWYVTDTPKADRWLIFIAYMIGLSIGVHLLSLLAIPFIAILFYYKKSRVAHKTMSPMMMYTVLGFALLVGLQFMTVFPVWLHVLFGLAIPGLYVYAAIASPNDEKKMWWNTGLSFVMGFAVLMFVQSLFIPGLPQIAASFDYMFVNGFGMSLGMGMTIFALFLLGVVVAALAALSARPGADGKMPAWVKPASIAGVVGFSLLALFLALSFAGDEESWFFDIFKTLIKLAIFLSPVIFGVFVTKDSRQRRYILHMSLMMFAMALMGFSTYGTIVIRAYANTPINMNNPSDPYSLLSYINREQYGERPLAYGPHFAAEQIGYESGAEVYRPVMNASGRYTYEVVSEKGGYKYKSSDMMLFPRLGHMDDMRKNQYRNWLGLNQEEKPTMTDNLDFFFRYQIGWMYFRYFMWNFAGRQNAQQGFFEMDRTKGNWMSGISIVDGQRLVPQSNLPKSMKEDKGRNTYYFLPLIFGLIGLIFHISKRPQEALALGVLFLMTGIAIILFSNQPPNEPRERDYVLVGSMFTFCMWIGLAVPALYRTLSDLIKNKMGASAFASAFVLAAPLIMGFQNWDDHSRAKHTGARDYATNFLESCAPNAIIFTYGDNDTYPLWYAQEVEGIRTDIRVVNFSLLAVDWYIDQLRRKINESPAVKMTIPREAYQGSARNILQIQDSKRPMNLIDVVRFMGESHPVNNQMPSYVPTADIVIPVDKAKVRANNAVSKSIPDSLIENQVRFRLNGRMLFKDDIALMDILGTNIANGWERPVYFAVTVRPSKIGGLKDYLQFEGMALRVVPVKTPSGGPYGAMSMGRTEIDTVYRNMMERFRWGGFDQYDLFVDESYSPSVQTLQFAFMRVASELEQKGDKERAVKLLDKLYASFPHMNFPIDEGYSRLQGLELYNRLGAEENMKPHLRDLVETVSDKLNYYSSFTNPVDIVSFTAKLNELKQRIQQKGNQRNAIIKQMDVVPEAQKQQYYNQALKLDAEYNALVAEKDQYLSACDNPEMVSVFEDEIMMATSQVSLALRLLKDIKDEAYVKEMEALLTAVGFPPVQRTPQGPPINTELTPGGQESIKVDSSK